MKFRAFPAAFIFTPDGACPDLAAGLAAALRAKINALKLLDLAEDFLKDGIFIKFGVRPRLQPGILIEADVIQAPPELAQRLKKRLVGGYAVLTVQPTIGRSPAFP
jgi:hypothetical protein